MTGCFEMNPNREFSVTGCGIWVTHSASVPEAVAAQAVILLTSQFK